MGTVAKPGGHKHRQFRGFTLIELMVVMVIIALGAGLVAPLTLKQLDKSRAQSEFLTMRNTLKTLTTVAFSRGFGYQVMMQDKSMIITSAIGEQAYAYNHITLPNVSFFVNHNGFPSVEVLTIQVGNKEESLGVADILGVKEDEIYAQTR